jgi:hypothetical protein
MGATPTGTSQGRKNPQQPATSGSLEGGCDLESGSAESRTGGGHGGGRPRQEQSSRRWRSAWWLRMDGNDMPDSDSGQTICRDGNREQHLAIGNWSHPAGIACTDERSSSRKHITKSIMATMMRQGKNRSGIVNRNFLIPTGNTER